LLRQPIISVAQQAENPLTDAKRTAEAPGERRMTGLALGRLRAASIATFSAASLPVGALVTTLGVYLTNYHASHFSIAPATAGFTFTAVRFLDLILDPLLGIAMDRTSTRFGRFRPWLALSSPVLLISVFMLYLPSEDVGAVYLFIWLAVIYAGYSLLTLSQTAWGAVLVEEYHQRSVLLPAGARLYARPDDDPAPHLCLLGACQCLRLPRPSHGRRRQRRGQA
jgi:hypothetical protein